MTQHCFLPRPAVSYGVAQAPLVRAVLLRLGKVRSDQRTFLISVLLPLRPPLLPFHVVRRCAHLREEESSRRKTTSQQLIYGLSRKRVGNDQRDLRC